MDFGVEGGVVASRPLELVDGHRLAVQPRRDRVLQERLEEVRRLHLEGEARRTRAAATGKKPHMLETAVVPRAHQAVGDGAFGMEGHRETRHGGLVVPSTDEEIRRQRFRTLRSVPSKSSFPPDVGAGVQQLDGCQVVIRSGVLRLGGG
eukprot:scaffold608_cov248-Pinguiococcus_pyrenoidosus.AAC.3